MANQPMHFWQTSPQSSFQTSASQLQYLPNIGVSSCKCIMCGSCGGCACVLVQDSSAHEQVGSPSMTQEFALDSDGNTKDDYNNVEQCSTSSIQYQNAAKAISHRHREINSSKQLELANSFISLEMPNQLQTCQAEVPLLEQSEMQCSVRKMERADLKTQGSSVTRQKQEIRLSANLSESANSSRKSKALYLTTQPERSLSIRQTATRHRNRQLDFLDFDKRQHLDPDVLDTQLTNRSVSESISPRDSTRQLEMPFLVMKLNTSKPTVETVSDAATNSKSSPSNITAESDYSTTTRDAEIMISPRKLEVVTSVREPLTLFSSMESEESSSARKVKLPNSPRQIQMPVLRNFMVNAEHLDEIGPSINTSIQVERSNSTRNLEKPQSPKHLDKSNSQIHLEKPGLLRHSEKQKPTSESFIKSDKSLFVGPYEGQNFKLQHEELQKKIQELTEQQKLQKQQLYSITFGDNVVDNKYCHENEKNLNFPPALRKLLNDPKYLEFKAEGLKAKDSKTPFPIPLYTIEAYPMLVPHNNQANSSQIVENEMSSHYNLNSSPRHPQSLLTPHLESSYLCQSSQFPHTSDPSHPVYHWQEAEQHENGEVDVCQLSLPVDNLQCTDTKKGLTAGGPVNQIVPNNCEAGDPANELYKSHNKKRMADKSPEGCLEVIDTECREAFLHIPLCPLVPDFDMTEQVCPSQQNSPPSCGGGRACSARGGAGADQPSTASQSQPSCISPVSVTIPTATSAQYSLGSRSSTPFTVPISPAELPSQKIPAPQLQEQRYSNVEDAVLYEHIKNLKQVHERAKCILNNAVNGSFPATSGCPPGGPPNNCFPSSGEYGNNCNEGACPPSKCCTVPNNTQYPKICSADNDDGGTTTIRDKSLHSYVHKLVDAVTDDLNNQIRNTVLQGVMDFIHKNNVDISGEEGCKTNK